MTGYANQFTFASPAPLLLRPYLLRLHLSIVSSFCTFSPLYILNYTQCQWPPNQTIAFAPSEIPIVSEFRWHRFAGTDSLTPKSDLNSARARANCSLAGGVGRSRDHLAQIWANFSRLAHSKTGFFTLVSENSSPRTRKFHHECNVQCNI